MLLSICLRKVAGNEIGELIMSDAAGQDNTAAWQRASVAAYEGWLHLSSSGCAG